MAAPLRSARDPQAQPDGVPEADAWAGNGFAAMVDQLTDVVVRLDGDGFIRYVNEAWRQLSGLGPRDSIGADLRRYLHPQDRQRVAECLATAPDAEQAWEMRLLDVSGAIRWIEARGRAVRSSDGTRGFVGVLRDISMRKQADADAQEAYTAAELARDDAVRARDAAERASQAKSEFLSRMSHELRTPLNSILGFGQLLEFSRLGDDDSENVALILRAGRHLLELVNDALDIARVETGRLALLPETLHLAELTAECFDLVRPAAMVRDVTLAPPGPGLRQAYALADRQRLRQVLLNLLSNAVKYNRDGGTVTVDCVPSADPDRGADGPNWLRLTVSDTGVGIPTARFDEVFQPFERLGAEHSDIEGSGVGLSLAKSLVEAMGGRIGLSSIVGVGSTFHVELPVARPPLPEEPADAPARRPGPAAAEPRRRTYVVLYIEDNPSNVTLMRRVLAQRPNIELLTTGDGSIGLEMVRQHPPDVLLLDVHLPQLDSIRVLTALRHDDDPHIRDVPVIMVTADLSAGAEQRMLAAGATAFLAKPFSVTELLEMIDKHLTAVPNR